MMPEVQFRVIKQGMFCVIEDDVVIGKNFSMRHFCEIRKGCVIGDNVEFGSRITLAENTVIGHNVIIKYGCVTTDTRNLKRPAEKVSVVIKDGARIGANVTMMPGITIGKNARIDAGLTLFKSVDDNAIILNPKRYNQ